MGIKVLKEVEDLAVSKLETSQQSAAGASCQAAKQFLHEEPYEQASLSTTLQPLHCAGHAEGQKRSLLSSWLCLPC